MIKIICALIGFAILNIPGAFIGWFLGSGIERYVNYGAGGVNPFTGQQRQQVFLQTLFQLAGRMAKADGHISPEEIALTEQLMRQMGMQEPTRKQAIEQFHQGADERFDVDQCLKHFLEVCGRTHSLRQMLILYLVNIALADNRLDSREEKLLQHIALRIGFSQRQLDDLMRMNRHQQRFSQSQPNAANELEEAYAALGVKSSDTDAVIKKAYRRLMSQYHPDKLMGQGVPQDMLKIATEKAKDIQRAYDLIKQNRK